MLNNLIKELFKIDEKKIVDIVGLKTELETATYYLEMFKEESEAMRKEIRERVKHELIMQDVINNLRQQNVEWEKEVSNLKEIIRGLSKYVR